ncbi:flavodoxin family protein [Devosia sp. A16]|uniref:flavodoxin family protein n=1 Tax=Devosia sp. A16 TaxID=1736675 RepID=UPI0006D814F2|nr:flavodoxin domain-containing protein [Devosia sp. A16]
MNITVIYDSIYGNTARVASAIAAALEPDNSVRLMPVQQARQADLGTTNLLIVGSPTRGFRPTPQISDLLAGLAPPSAAAEVAVFDTRLAPAAVRPGALRWVVEVGGYAASRMDEILHRRGYVRRGEIAGFLVDGMKGPLKPGEVERAAEWARSLV